MSEQQRNLADLWRDNPLINPRTNKRITAGGAVYKKLVREFGFDPLVNDDNPSQPQQVGETFREKFLNNPGVNPRTGKKIKIGGPVYKKLVAEFGDPVAAPVTTTTTVAPTPNLSENCIKWLANKTVNPITGRKIKVGGPVYKKLEAECSVENSDQQVPVPIPPPTIDSDCEEWLQNKTVNPATGRKIKPGGAIYKRLEQQCAEDLFLIPPAENISVQDDNLNRPISPVPQTENIDGRVFVRSQSPPPQVELTRLDLFEQLALEKGFTMTNVPLDGNCMWTAIGSYFNLSAIELRSHVLEYAQKCNNIDQTFINDLTVDGKWCGDEMLQIIANALHIKIVVLNEQTETLTEIISIPKPNDERVIFLGYLSDFHYVILTPENTSQKLFKIRPTFTCPAKPLLKANVAEVRPERRKVSVSSVDQEDIKSLIKQINDIKNFARISTFMETESPLLKAVGLI